VVGEVPQTNWQQTFPGSALSGNVAVFNDPSLSTRIITIAIRTTSKRRLPVGSDVSTFVGTSGPEWAAGLAGKR